MHVYLLEDDTFWIHSLKVSCLGNLLLGKSPILNGLSLLQSHPSVNEACTIVDCDHLLEQPGKKEAGDARSTAKVESASPRPVDLLQSPLNQTQQRQSIALCLYVEVQMYIKQHHEAIYIAHSPGLMPSSHTANWGMRICIEQGYHIKLHIATLMCLKQTSVSFSESDAQTISSFVYWSGNETRCSHTHTCWRVVIFAGCTQNGSDCMCSWVTWPCCSSRTVSRALSESYWNWGLVEGWHDSSGFTPGTKMGLSLYVCVCVCVCVYVHGSVYVPTHYIMMTSFQIPHQWFQLPAQKLHLSRVSLGWAWHGQAGSVPSGTQDVERSASEKKTG